MQKIPLFPGSAQFVDEEESADEPPAPEPDPDADLAAEAFSESDHEEIYKPKPTRSGRVPKRRRLQAPEANSMNESKGAPQADDVRQRYPDLGQMAPGSIVLENREVQPGKQVLQVRSICEKKFFKFSKHF